MWTWRDEYDHEFDDGYGSNQFARESAALNERDGHEANCAQAAGGDCTCGRSPRYGDDEDNGYDERDETPPLPFPPPAPPTPVDPDDDLPF